MDSRVIIVAVANEVEEAVCADRRPRPNDLYDEVSSSRLEFQAIQALQELPEGAPVYYRHYEHYLFNYAGLGFADAPLSNGHNFSVESLAELIRGEAMPPCIYALYNYPWLGGEKIRGLIGFAEVDEELSSEIVEEFQDGRYTLILVRIQKEGTVCPG
jgi:hypothetical protein